MKFSHITLTFAALASTILAAYVPSDPWTGLTPDSPAPTGATTDHTHPFGIQIVLVGASAAKRAVDQITDGQIQANSATLASPTPTVIQQISDGQIQQQTTAQPIQQIGDGQIQHQTTVTPIQQIGDGQIQHQTTVTPIQQIGDGQIQHQTTVTPIQQIGDGQIQHQTTVTPIQQIGDGQIQHQTTNTAIQQISDGQILNPTGTAAAQISDGQIQNPTGTAAAQISDGQVQQTGTPESSDGTPQACGTDSTLSMSITGGILTDSKGRIGAIVANRQFQFDGPPPQAGTIYAAGWSITTDGYLALGSSTQFYQCLSGDFYNLYDQSIGAQCSEVHLSIVDLVTC